MHKLLATLALAAAATAACAADYIVLPGGSFTSVLPQGSVPSVSAPVAIGPFALRDAPVTVGEFAAFVRQHPEWMRGRAPPVLADARYLLHGHRGRSPAARWTAASRSPR